MKHALVLLLSLLPMTGFADASDATELLARMRHEGETKFRYEETRTLELVTSPWHGNGYMLSGADGSLVKLQLQPNRIVMAIAHQRMYYWDPDQKQRHSAPLGSGGPAAQQIAVFRSIMQGQVDELEKSYDFSSEKHGQEWILRMTPKAELNGENVPAIELSGDQDANRRQLVITQPDGESTEYKMVKIPEEHESEYSVERLLKEAIGD